MARHDPSPARRDRSRLSWFAVLWACVWGGFTLVFLFVAVAQWTGLDPAWDPEVVLGAVATALFTGAVGAAGVIMAHTRRPRPAPLVQPPAARAYPWPCLQSSARQPMLDLAEVEGGLAELLRQLTDMPDGPAVPPHVLDQARATAADTATKLRSVAARLEAVELAIKHAPPREWAGLEDGAGGLRLRLDQGLDAYRTLIAAAGRVVLASTPVVASAQLVEATESLAGLAEALRELSPPEG